MRTSALLTALLLVGILLPDGLQAQASRLGAPGTSLRPLQPFAALSRGVDGGSATLEDRLLTALTSAALGAGVGFFMSHVDQSDWDEIPGRREASRGLWSALGGGLGLAVGLSFPVSLTEARPVASRVEPPRRSVILPGEIEEISADNAYQIVRLLRPEWLNTRPPNIIGEVEPDGLPVFLDDFWYGDLDSMRSIHIQTIERIQFVPATTATARWGAGYPRGVIQIITVG